MLLDAIRNFFIRFFDSKSNKWIKYEEEIHYLRNQIGFYQNEIKRLTDVIVEMQNPIPERQEVKVEMPKAIGKIPWQVHANKLREEELKQFEKFQKLEMKPNETTEQLEEELAVNG